MAVLLYGKVAVVVLWLLIPVPTTVDPTVPPASATEGAGRSENMLDPATTLAGVGTAVALSLMASAFAFDASIFAAFAGSFARFRGDALLVLVVGETVKGFSEPSGGGGGNAEPAPVV